MGAKQVLAHATNGAVCRKVWGRGRGGQESAPTVTRRAPATDVLGHVRYLEQLADKLVDSLTQRLSRQRADVLYG